MSIWEHVPTGSTHIRPGQRGGEFVVMTTANGNTYYMNASTNPVWHTPDRRLAVHKIDGTSDFLIERTEGGVDLLFCRLGQTNFVRLARRGTLEWNDTIRLMNGGNILGDLLKDIR